LHSSLADFKPLIMRGSGECFRFVLHHRFPGIHIHTDNTICD
jgi:hypothetical protein